MRLDFTDPATVHKMAALPHFGWAEALIRKVDPWWHAPEGPYSFRVDLVDGDDDSECPHCGCSCGNYSAPVCKMKVWVEAWTEEEAQTIAETENPGWFADFVHPPRFPTTEVPSEYLEWFEAAA